MPAYNIPTDVKALIFDCDGTIADTMPLHYEAYRDALGADAVHLTPEMFYAMAGVPAVPFMQALKDKYALTFDATEVATNKEKMFGEILHSVKSIESVEAVIRQYHGRLPMAVASGGTRENITRILEHLNLLSFFESVITADEVPNGKPEPDIFLRAADVMKVPPELCLVFEDADMGIKAAHAAGMRWIDVREQ